MRELGPGVWHWEALHPEWEGSVQRGQPVSSYGVDVGGLLLLIDPIAPPSEILELAAGWETAVVLTAPWHERDARSVVERFGWPLFAPRPDAREDLMRKYGVTAEQAAGGSPDLAWLAGHPGEAHLYAAGDPLPAGVKTFPGWEHNDVVVWIENRGAIVVGDSLVDFGEGLEASPGEKHLTRDQIAQKLRPLLDLPVEQVLATHGGPTDRAALERALA